MKVKSEDTVPYFFTRAPLNEKEEQQTIDMALNILSRRLNKPEVAVESPENVRSFLALKLTGIEREKFCLLFLNNRHGVLEFEEMFQGTIDGCTVHPREVVKRALQLNAAAVVLAHNHPSGNAEPSQADIKITRRLTEALALVDIRVLDHIVVGAGEMVSFAERGLI